MVMEKIELVEIEDLSYWYPGNEGAALEGITLGLAPGEFVLLVGASGSGKSTLCRALNGLVPHFYGGRMAGTVKVDGIDTRSAEVRDLARTIGMVFQDPENQMITDDPVSEVAFGLENMGVERPQMLKRVEEVLASLRLSEMRDKRVGELSGGQKQKLALASVLAMHPRVLVLDEPTSQLDPISAEEFLSTLKSLNDELGLVVVLAEHRVERCFHFADRVVALDSGRLEFEGTPREIAKWGLHRTWVPLPPVTRLFANGKGDDLPLTVKEGRVKVAGLAKERTEVSDPVQHAPRVAAGKRPRRKGGTGSGPLPVIETTSLWHIYDDGTEALRGVDLVIEPGEFVAIIGENGSGKTTLVRHFNGLLRPTRGEVLVDGAAIKGVEVARLARTCGMLGQDPNLQLVADTTRSELETSLKAMDIPREAWTSMVEEALEMCELSRFRDANPQDLSCGERERVALASVLVYRPKILVLDEPTRGVDQGTKDRLGGYLERYNKEGNTVILVTHDLEFAAGCCRRMLMMGSGRVLADGEKQSVLADSLFFTTQYNKCFRDVADRVVTREEAAAVLEAMT